MPKMGRPSGGKKRESGWQPESVTNDYGITLEKGIKLFWKDPLPSCKLDLDRKTYGIKQRLQWLRRRAANAVSGEKHPEWLQALLEMIQLGVETGAGLAVQELSPRAHALSTCVLPTKDSAKNAVKRTAVAAKLEVERPRTRRLLRRVSSEPQSVASEPCPREQQPRCRKHPRKPKPRQHLRVLIQSTPEKRAPEEKLTASAQLMEEGPAEAPEAQAVVKKETGSAVDRQQLKGLHSWLQKCTSSKATQEERCSSELQQNAPCREAVAKSLAS